MQFSVLLSLVFCLAVSARPMRRAPFTLKNGQDAIALNNEFQNLTVDSPCNSGENACVNGQFAQCVNGQFELTPCPSGTVCAALPLVNKAGTSISCDSQSDIDARIAATGASSGGNGTSSSNTKNQGKNKSNNNNNGQDGGNGDNSQDPQNQDPQNQDNGGDQQGGGNNDNSDPQTSLTLDPSVIADGFNNDGQNPPVAGQTASLTSTNNFINFCVNSTNSKGLPITNGQQIKTGSCNPAPMGEIPSTDHMPSAKFVFPKNFDTVKANKNFTVQMAIRELQTGNFVNANENYFSAPQQLEDNGQVKGHSHIVIEKLSGLDQTDPTDPNTFAFFKGLNDQEQGGVLTAVVAGGLPEGTYKISSINTAANHQPVLVPVAQHGSLDDVVYFTVTNSGKPDSNS